MASGAAPHVMVLIVLMILCMGGEVAPREGVPPPENCTRSCGGVDVPYPFGLDDDVSEDCYRSYASFSLTCNRTHYNPPKLFWGNIPVEGIILSLGQARFLWYISYDCYNRSTYDAGTRTSSAEFTDSLALSYKENVFVAVGCDMEVRFQIGAGNDTFGGCMSGCNSLDDGIEDGQCTGIGCCQTSLPKHIKQYKTKFIYRSTKSKTYTFNNCSYAFMVEKRYYTFHKSDLTYMNQSSMFPIVADWFIGDQSCEEAMKNSSGYACVSNNSECFDSTNGPGYTCNCSLGYQGNPYLEGGCQDINECEPDRKEQYPCHGTCLNTIGGYNCTCREGFTWKDAKLQECVPLPEVARRTQIPLAVIVGIGAIGGLLLLLVGILLFCVGYQRRKNFLLRKEFFERNGGNFLERALSTDPITTFRIFTKDELEKATKNFDKDLIVGHGGFGEVYKGFIEGGTTIAVKRSMTLDEKNGKEFANEILILSKVNQKNIVKLLGCCLESKVPMLVYEYIPGGTLFNYLHNNRGQLLISFKTRIRIASEAASALKYLHVDASPPICHGDIKTSNILLDDGHVAKISDFGTSTLASKDKAQFKTLVQGTYGYLDPEYLLTGQLTCGSDVFSFGVVLAELLTRRLPFKSETHGSGQSLANCFLSCANNNKLEEILDEHIISEGVTEEVMKVAEITVRCLSMKGEDRPTMKEVEARLEELSAAKMHPWEPYQPEEENTLLEGPSSYKYDATMETRAIFGVERAR